MASKNTRSKSKNFSPSISASSVARPAEKSDANAVKSTVASGPATAPAKAPTPVAAVVAAPVAVAAPAAPVAVAPTIAKTAPTTTLVAEPARDRSAIVNLVARLRDPDAEVARDAAATLGRLPSDAEAVAALSAVLVNGDGYYHSVVRAAAAASLGTLGDRSAVDALIHATNDAMAEASEEAIKALGTLGDARAVATLETIVRNDNGFFLTHVQHAAQESLRKIRGGKA